MFSFLIAIVLSFSIWIVFALINRGRQDQEIRETLNLIFLNLQDLLRHVKRLFLLLVKDAIETDLNELNDFLTNKTFRQKTISTVSQGHIESMTSPGDSGSNE